MPVAKEHFASSMGKFMVCERDWGYSLGEEWKGNIYTAYGTACHAVLEWYNRAKMFGELTQHNWNAHLHKELEIACGEAGVPMSELDPGILRNAHKLFEIYASQYDYMPRSLEDIERDVVYDCGILKDRQGTVDLIAQGTDGELFIVDYKFSSSSQKKNAKDMIQLILYSMAA